MICPGLTGRESPAPGVTRNSFCVPACSYPFSVPSLFPLLRTPAHSPGLWKIWDTEVTPLDEKAFRAWWTQAKSLGQERTSSRLLLVLSPAPTTEDREKSSWGRNERPTTWDQGCGPARMEGVSRHGGTSALWKTAVCQEEGGGRYLAFLGLQTSPSLISTFVNPTYLLHTNPDSDGLGLQNHPISRGLRPLL